jgi:hypothetical protein
VTSLLRKKIAQAVTVPWQLCDRNGPFLPAGWSRPAVINRNQGNRQAASAIVPRWRLGRLAPSLADVFFIVLLAAVFAQPAGLRALLADGDTGWHIRAGELVLATGHVPVTDPFSFTRSGEAWFAWEWLADVSFAVLYRWRGLAAVAAGTGALLALAATLIFARLLRRGCGLWIGLAAALAAASASSIHYLARPHVFTILFYALGLWLIQEDRHLWTLVPMTALWANLHAGFVAWLATMGVLVAVRASEHAWGRVRRYLALAAACSAASLANPYGWRLHEHVARYLGSRWILDNVQEFQSPSIRSEGAVVFAVLLLAAVALAPRASRFEGALVLIWGFAALRSARHVPLFAIAAAPVAASGCAALWERAAARARVDGAVRVAWELGRDLGRASRPGLWVPVAAAIFLLAVPPVSFPAGRFPVAAVDRNVSRLAPGGQMPRILTSDQWADYLIFRLYPRQRVFFDGRSDFFGPSLGGDYRKLMTGDRDWRELMDRYAFQLALLPRDWPLSWVLERDPEWRRVYADEAGVLYERVVPPGGVRRTGVEE